MDGLDNTRGFFKTIFFYKSLEVTALYTLPLYPHSFSWRWQCPQSKTCHSGFFAPSTTSYHSGGIAVALSFQSLLNPALGLPIMSLPTGWNQWLIPLGIKGPGWFLTPKQLSSLCGAQSFGLLVAR
jgi:hypothetical protein